jgi:DNA ligase-1
MQYSRTLVATFVALAFSAPSIVVTTHASPPPLVLAESYHSQIDLSRYWISEKYDGARAWWNGREFISRGGNVYRAPAWFTRDLPKQTLDGELWMGRGNFQLLMQTIRDHTPNDAAWRRVRFMVFDAPEIDGDFEQRQQWLAQAVGATANPALELVTQQRVANHAALHELLEQVSAAGGEGLMLAHTASRYRPGRHNGLIKMKLHQDAEATVIQHLPGKGKYRNVMGSLLVEDEQGLRFRLGTGFTDAERAAPPPAGAIVSYRYQGRTKSGKPRFARFLRVRPAE